MATFKWSLSFEGVYTDLTVKIQYRLGRAKYIFVNFLITDVSNFGCNETRR